MKSRDRFEKQRDSPCFSNLSPRGIYRGGNMLKAIRSFFSLFLPPVLAPVLSAIVDLDAAPKLPSWLSFEGQGVEGRKLGRAKFEKRGGKLYVNGRRVAFHLSPDQKGGRRIGGHKLREELAATPGTDLNAAAKDFLRSRPEFIPDDAPDMMYFWATIPTDTNGLLSVSCLVRYDDGWDNHWHWLDFNWSSSRPAARLEEQVA